MRYHVQTTTDKGWQTYESFKTKGEAIAHKEEWADEFPEVDVRIVTEYGEECMTYNAEDLIDKVVEWLEEEVRTNAPEAVLKESTYDDYVYLCRGRAECAASLIRQIDKWREEKTNDPKPVQVQKHYEVTVDAKGNWAVCKENGGDVIADLMTEEDAIKICNLLNEHERRTT